MSNEMKENLPVGSSPISHTLVSTTSENGKCTDKNDKKNAPTQSQ